MLAWLGFSLLYYGAPLPNTAYAKLAAGVPRALLWSQGLAYLVDSLSRDVLLPITLAAAVVLGWRAGGRMHRLLVLGVGAQVVYVVAVGGDFMSGRFLTAPYVVSVMVLVTAVFRHSRGATLLGSGALLAAVVLTGPYKALSPPVEPCRVPDHGVTDERSCYADFTALARNLHKGEHWIYQTHNYPKEGRAWRERGERVVVGPLVGLAGVAAGPSVHIIDEAALTDPLLARLPYDYEPTRHWRIGHFYRRLPPGYFESVRDGVNRIVDPCVAKYYAVIREVTRGPLLSRSRLRRVWELNTGRYERYLEGRCD
ncbi:MAG: hypothetical protein KF718_15620 [Polyangiaceae bacterium]|nr:hypothetical protein [Polyangiaceae bacterium]